MRTSRRAPIPMGLVDAGLATAGGVVMKRRAAGDPRPRADDHLGLDDALGESDD